ncbi:hypothetical protein V502_03394 [Pseudogymnoascus sp. VKM F-4520 (FW-2644)]|nr:hypothetical protein V502_03394 [Pseudogymnoascus sp. VKM F-4520 (FW-2644)]
MTTTYPQPPYEPELEDFLDKFPFPRLTTLEQVAALRADPLKSFSFHPDTLIAGRPITHTERHVPSMYEGDPDILLSIFSRNSSHDGLRPCIYWVHGGGMMMGDRFGGLDRSLECVNDFDCLLISVEYRLAPNHPDPAPVHDSYAGLYWVGEHLEELGIDPERLLIGGGSAGGGIAAGTALMARDLKGPKLCGQFLSSPMLDDRNVTVSTMQFEDKAMWCRATNIMAWNALLSNKAGQEGVSIYAAPARAKNLEGLPETFIGVGSCDLFRDEDVLYAMKLWAGGVQAEIHVYPGGTHGFETFKPKIGISVAAIEDERRWLRKMLELKAVPSEKEEMVVEIAAL